MSSRVPGRDRECEQLDDVLDAVRTGHSRALVIRGEPGIGKTRLLDYLVECAHGFRVARITGIQSEMELVYAGVHQLCAPMAGALEALPGQQRAAVAAALGQGGEPAPDGFLVALGVLGLLSEVAREQPLLCVVDDAQWLDRASMPALAFTARRLVAESVAVVFAVRSPPDALGAEPVEPVGIPELRLAGLREADARALLRATMPGPWDENVLSRVVAETRGNPLALLELPKTSGPVELAGGFGLPAARMVDARLRAAYLSRIGELPIETQQFLLAAAADPTGEPVLLWQAADRLGIHLGAAEPAVADGLLEIGERVGFAHPLVRSVVYWAAGPDARRAAHRALAAATDPHTDPDRRAWHAAHGATGPDETIAAELERSALRARVRGGLAAAAAFTARAVDLTPDAECRRDRALVAARANHEAGNPDTALKLLSLAEAGLRDDRLRAEAELVRARIAFTTDRGIAAPALLLDAARRLARHDAEAARETYLEVIDAALFAGPKAYRRGQYEAALAARATPAPPDPRPADLLLDALATRILDGHTAAVPALRSALDAFRRAGLAPNEALRWLWLTAVTAVGLWDDALLSELSIRNLDLVRATGRASALPIALTLRGIVHILDGELTAAESLAAEVHTVSEAVGAAAPVFPALLAAGWRGRETECLELNRRAEEGEQHRGEGIGPVVGGYARAVLYNGLSRFDEAAAAARVSNEEYVQLEVGIPVWSLVEYIEATTRTGDTDRAFDALVRLAEITRSSGSDWARGIEARSHALLSTGPDAETRYRAALSHLGGTGLRGELARAHLLYGEWLSHEHRGPEAREHLHTAHELFTTMGMAAFAGRSARALATTGANIRELPAETGADLTTEETQVVKLVHEGLTDPEIAARLFISPPTVEWHLRNLCTKLGLRTRHQLETWRPAP
ncbi:LuxR family transcriptional regulator [Nocardia carnea]|uniref:LuxR family transcriptional regulator n=1 Tax=Nocardia carnea TaxID=37328 RepID=UPI00245410DF|nr:LuxR family transcriptional regulator [Nocardia carnea]